MKRSEAECFVRRLYEGVLLREPDELGFQHHVAALVSGISPTAIVEAFVGCSEFKALHDVRLFVPPGHFYSPIVDVAEASSHLDRMASKDVPRALPGISISESELLTTWSDFLPFFLTNPFPEIEKPEFRYAFENPAYSYADGSVLHAMLRLHTPRRVVEVGSGWSSACTVDTIERFLDGKCRVTFIEPYPQLLVHLLGETSVPSDILEMPIQNVPLSLFESLQSGDFLFIDSTHVLRTGSDVCFELFEILPRLASGVFVHFHDIFWPFEYPRSWVVDENRSWNEIYALRAFLTNNPDWKVIFFNDYFAKIATSTIQATYPAFLKNTGGAIWLQRR